MLRLVKRCEAYVLVYTYLFSTFLEHCTCFSLASLWFHLNRPHALPISLGGVVVVIHLDSTNSVCHDQQTYPVKEPLLPGDVNNDEIPAVEYQLPRMTDLRRNSLALSWAKTLSRNAVLGESVNDFND